MSRTQYKAGIALGMATVGFIASYPSSSSFYGGMLNSGCWAAMVGGLADWFAVTALFRKPLGISYRTAIIPKNRERIFNDLVAFVEYDLLSKENIVRTISKYNIAELLINYMEENKGKEGAKDLARKIAQDVLGKLDSNDIGNIIETLIKDNATKVKISPVIAQALEWTVKNGYDERIVNFILDELIRIVDHSQMRSTLSKLFAEVKEVYERGMKRRQFVSWLLDLSPDKLATVAQDELCDYLRKLKNPAHPLRVKLKAWIASNIVQLKTNTEFQNQIESWKIDIIKSKLSVGPQISQYVAYLREAAATYHGESDHWMYKIDSIVDKLVDGFKQNQEQQNKVDSWVKAKVESNLAYLHGSVAAIVRERLGEFTDDLLVDFIEGKVGNDLQMIRINGSVIGGLVGILIYLVTYCIERIWWLQ